MIKRFIFGALLAGIIITAGRPQVGPLPGMAILPVTSAHVFPACSAINVGTKSDNTGASTVALSGVTVPAHSLIVVYTAENGSGVTPTVSDGSNTYNLAHANITGTTFSMVYAFNTIALSSGTITFTKQHAADPAAMSIIYATGIHTAANPLDISGVGIISNSTPSITSSAAAQAGELFIGGMGTSTTVTVTQDTADGWSFPPNTVNVTLTLSGGSLTNSGSGAKTYAPTLSGSASGVISIDSFICG